MGVPNILMDSTDRIRSTRHRIQALARERPEGWKKDYANARLALEDEFSALIRAGSSIPNNAEPDTPAAAFHAALSRCKTVLASHQARWPVILLKEADEAYEASTAQINDAFERLTVAIRAIPSH